MQPADRKNFFIPSPYQIPLEVFGVVDAAKLAFQFSNLTKQKKGNGERILVFPGFNTDDPYTYFLRSFLNQIGYNAQGWEIGKNHGNVPVLLETLNAKIRKEYNEHKEKIILIGWSLGGYLAREVARDNQELVSKVITLASPIVGGPKYTSIARVFPLNGITIDELEKEIDERYKNPLKLPVLAIYSKKDNIVGWEACIDNLSPNTKHVEIDSTHIGFIVNVEAYKLISEFL